jgi:ribosomal protein S18 acetylase RimI-like enzyme
MMSDPIRIRAAQAEDLDTLGPMAGALVRYHHGLDPRRFLLVEGVEEGYQRFFGTELGKPSTVLLVAERGGRTVGYAYARLEPRDWNSLLDACGALHDIFVMDGERRGGVASALLGEVRVRLAALGAPRVVLSSAVQNEGAQRLFERHGFRRTMVEMTLELA